MAKNKQKNTESKSSLPSSGNAMWFVIGVVSVLAILGIIYLLSKPSGTNQPVPGATTQPAPTLPTTANTNTNPVAQQTPPTPPQTKDNSELTTMDVAKAVMVTVEEDFGKNATIASALQQVERRYTPDDGSGRTFAILDAYGETMPDGKIHMSMHVSSEEAGTAQLIHKKTGKVLWNAKINPVTVPPQPKALRILVDGAPGGSFNIDVNSANNVMNATASGKGVPVMAVWPDGAEMEVTFIYSMCGCPVKAKVKRVGDRTMRTADTPVMFPDDPDALKTIAKFMKW
jgi:hypothetical protein